MDLAQWKLLRPIGLGYEDIDFLIHRRICTMRAWNLLKPAVSRDMMKNRVARRDFYRAMSAIGDTKYVISRIMRDSRENGFHPNVFSGENSHAKWKFLTVLIDGSYIFSPFFLLSYQHITSDWFTRYWPSSIFRVDIRNDYRDIREINPLAGNFFLILSLLSHRNIIERFILSTCKKFTVWQRI